MTENRITSLQNPRVKAWRALKETKGRAAQRLFLAEGDHLTGEALAARAANVLLVGEGGCEKYARHMETARRQNTEICILGDHVMEALCDAKTPQGVIAVCAMPDLMAPLPPDKMKLAALDGVQDPGNVGTVLRTLDAAGFDALLIDGRTADPYGPKALRASMGAVLLTAGAKGKRHALPNSRIMIHQPWGGAEGKASDIEITAKEILRLKEILNGILAKHSGKKMADVVKDTDRDHFMSAAEAVEWGLVDKVVE